MGLFNRTVSALKVSSQSGLAHKYAMCLGNGYIMATLYHSIYIMVDLFTNQKNV